MKVFAINLEERVERKKHILSEFEKYREFELTIVKATQHNVGSWGLWLTIKNIVQNAIDNDEDYIIICEDDHAFTEAYDKETLKAAIHKLKSVEADVLLGGVSWFETVLPISKDLFWVKKFNGLQFTIIFRRYYQTLLSLEIAKGQDADIIISSNSDRSFVLYPYISVQKEFGYSDVTDNNQQPGYVTEIFKNSQEKLKQLNQVADYYKKI